MQHATFQFTMAGPKNKSKSNQVHMLMELLRDHRVPNVGQVLVCCAVPWPVETRMSQRHPWSAAGSNMHGTWHGTGMAAWHGAWRRTVQFWTPKWHEASRSYRHAMVIGFRWFAMCFLYLLIPSWLRTQWSVPRGPWQFAQNPSLPVIDPAAGCCPLYPPYTLQSCGAICWINPRQVPHWFKWPQHA